MELNNSLVKIRIKFFAFFYTEKSGAKNETCEIIIFRVTISV